MSLNFVPVSQQCPFALLPAGPAWPHGWLLLQGRAITLRADRAHVLSVLRGRVWVTFSGAPGTPAGPAGADADVFVQAGDRVLVPQGRSLVMEPCGPQGPDSAVFVWQPALLPSVVPAWRGGGRASLVWRRWWSASAWAT